MALGNTNNENGFGGNEEKKYYPTVYSPMSFFNEPGDAVLGFKFVLSGILELRITPKIDGKFNDKNSISIYLSPTKAMILEQALGLLKEDIQKGILSNYGVTNGKKTSNVEFGYTKEGDDIKLYCTIYKYNNSGNIGDTYTFKFNNSDDIIKNFSPNDLSFDTLPIHDLPLTMIQNLLAEYCKGMTGGQAYGVEYCVGQYHYNVNSLKKMLGGSNKSSSANNIFNNGNGSSAGSLESDFTNGDLFDLE